MPHADTGDVHEPGIHGRRKRKGASPFTDLGDALDREPERTTFEFHAPAATPEPEHDDG